MFVTSLAASLPAPNRNSPVILGILVSLFLSVCGIYLYGNQAVDNVEVKQIIQRKTAITSQPEQPRHIDEKDHCKQLDIQYELQGVVFDHENTVALIKEIKSGTTMLISNIEVGRMKLKAAELSKVKVLQNGCSFTLHLNQLNDKDGHEIFNHHITAS